MTKEDEVKPLEKPPKTEEGDDTIAGGGTPKLVETKQSDLADTRELDETDYEDQDDESDT